MAWGEKIDEFAIKQGETLKVSVDLESREYNGRWYTDVKAWKIARDGLGDDNVYSNATLGTVVTRTVQPPIIAVAGAVQLADVGISV